MADLQVQDRCPLTQYDINATCGLVRDVEDRRSSPYAEAGCASGLVFAFP